MDEPTLLSYLSRVIHDNYWTNMGIEDYEYGYRLEPRRRHDHQKSFTTTINRIGTTARSQERLADRTWLMDDNLNQRFYRLLINYAAEASQCKNQSSHRTSAS